jgi:hypothetical protein
LKRGGVAGGWILASEGAEAVLKEPTSLDGGEGLAARSTGEVEGVEGEGEGGGGKEVVVRRWWWKRTNEHQPVMGFKTPVSCSSVRHERLSAQ